MYKVKILPNICIGAASCMAVSPKSFDLDEKGKVKVLDTIGDVSDEEILRAAQACPVGAIVVEDENGKQIWPK